MAPLIPHEAAKNVINTLVAAMRDELNIDIESGGSTTYRIKQKAKGAEPDGSFFIQNAAAVIGRHLSYNIERDPPPDLVIKTEFTNASLDKFPIYAGLGVPEFWRESQGVVRFYVLKGETYKEALNSRAFPFLDSATLTELLAKGLAEGSRTAAAAFRSWIREHRSA